MDYKTKKYIPSDKDLDDFYWFTIWRYSRTCLEKRYKKILDWRRNNPDKVIEYNQRRRSLVSNAEGSFTAAEWRNLLEEHKGKCAKCGTTEGITADHIIPLSKGGSNYISNIQPLCRSCNSSKGDRLTVEGD